MKLRQLITEIQVDNPKYDVEVDEHGDMFYYKVGTRIKHRIGGPAIEFNNGTNVWYQNGKLHRLDGPAIEYSDGSKKYFQNGKCHRLDGPAIEWDDGQKWWFINDEEYTEEEFNKITNKLNEIKVNKRWPRLN